MNEYMKVADDTKVAEAVAYCKQALAETGKGKILPAGQAALLLYGFTHETKKFLNLSELQKSILQVEAYYNEVMVVDKHHFLSVGEIRKQIENIPDNTPVLYQRIEDSYFAEPTSGWKTIPLLWDSHEIDENQAHLYENKEPDVKVFDRDGQKIVHHYSDYIPAWGSYVTKDDQGAKAFCIHAHY